jgi:hypothetical protein
MVRKCGGPVGPKMRSWHGLIGLSEGTIRQKRLKSNGRHKPESGEGRLVKIIKISYACPDLDIFILRKQKGK